MAFKPLVLVFLILSGMISAIYFYASFYVPVSILIKILIHIYVYVYIFFSLKLI